MGDDFIICNRVAIEPQCFILTPAEVATLAHRGEKDGRISYWLQPKAYEAVEYRDAWSRVGSGVAASKGDGADREP